MKMNVKWFPKWSYNAKMFYPTCCLYLGKIDGKEKHKTVYLFRYLLDAKSGECVDHIDHNPMNNTRENLRLTVVNKNTKHRKGANSNSKSGYRNVCWLKKENKWAVQLQIDGKNTRLAKFKEDELDKAVEYAEKMREKYYGEFKGNG